MDKCGGKYQPSNHHRAGSADENSTGGDVLCGLISGWNSGEATSHNSSKAVLSASAVQTETIANTMAIHSRRGIWKRRPRATAAKVATE